MLGRFLYLLFKIADAWRPRRDRQRYNRQPLAQSVVSPCAGLLAKGSRQCLVICIAKRVCAGTLTVTLDFNRDTVFSLSRPSLEMD